MVLRSRELEVSLGDGLKKIEKNEIETSVVQRRSICVKENIDNGRIHKKDIQFLRPCPVDSIEPFEFKKVIGKKLLKNKLKGEYIMGRSNTFIVPARNEEKTISGVIDFLIKYGDIIVIDDCSIDNTYNILLKYKITILKNIINQGYQKSVIRGLIEAKLDYEYAVTFDADGQHLGINMKNFINELNNNYDLIVTQRNIKNRFSENIICILKLFFQGIDLFSGMK